MPIARRLTGLAIILLSILGLLVCLAVIIGTWAGKRRLDPVVTAVFGTTDEALDAVTIKLDRAKQALETSQQRVSGLSRLAERLKNADTVAASEYDPMIQTVSDILDELKKAESWLDSSQTIVTTVSKVSQSLVSSEYAAAHPDATGVAIAESVQGFSESATDAIAKLQSIRQELIQIRESGKLAHEAALAIITRVADLDGRLNPNLAQAAVDEMLVQHLLTERLIRKIFDNPEFTRRNVIAAEVEKVITALTAKSFNRDEFLRKLDRFYKAIESTARLLEDFSEKQHFLNTVYERFFQGYSVKVADTHGIVYTPQAIVDFMCASVVEVLEKEFGKTLGDKDVHILDPCTGTGNFIVNLINRIPKRDLPRVYANTWHMRHTG